ncbi:MAG: enoyl-CoA hydratase-related protein [Firmicutes bacterium]|nr:enoyl-CoA hydratase-related protein [Bacillota bacterium]MCL5040484.1 enoyl-CoA hydratase-related protein [Bacillota bacterium]
MGYHLLMTQREKRLAIITVNRPPVNALSLETLEELAQALEELRSDDGVKVLIITGAGPKAFIAGADITQFAQGDAATVQRYIRRGQEVFRQVETYPKPVIAAINGVCLGGGNELAMACDLRLAAESARFGQPEINLGIIPGWGGTQRLTRLVGKTRAMEILLLGQMIDAQEAWRIGLINHVVPDGELLARARELGNQLASQPSLAMAAIKRLLDEGLNTSLMEGLDLELKEFVAVFETEDAREGVTAFLGKRKPDFKGR